MIKSYFKIAFRTLKRSKVYTLINVLGLGLGIACALLIFTLVKYHISFDTFHANTDRIYRVVTEFHRDEIGYSEGTPQPLGKAFRNEYTLAEKVARVYIRKDQLISIPSSKDNLKFQEEEGFAYAEQALFDILNFPLVRGDRHTALSEPGTAILTERIAEKYFGNQNPMGQTIRVNNKWDYRVTGILQDLPVNTNFRQEIYISYQNLKDWDDWLASDDSWGSIFGDLQSFVLLRPGIADQEVEKAFRALSEKYYDEESGRTRHFKLQPISDIHFNPNLGGYVEKKNLWALSLIGLFLIITSCVNFINLATAQALGRSREIGIRKTLGSRREQLFWQFIAETTLITILALILAFILAQLALPFVNQLFDMQLRINIFRDVYLLVFVPVLLLIVIFFSGSYPGLILAGFQPVLALKGKLSQRHIGGFSLRRSLVVAQFAISLLLIIGTIVIASQVRYSRQADLGFKKDAVVTFSVPDNGKSKIKTLKSRIGQLAGVEKVSFFGQAPASSGELTSNIRFGSRPEDEKFDIAIKAGDDQYVPTFNIKIVAGRNLYPSDTVHEFLLNETAVKRLNIPSVEDVIGKKIHLTANNYEGIVVGVVKDFHNKSFHETIDPICIITSSDWYETCAVKLNPSSLSPSLSAIEEVWKKTFPDHVYKYDFLDEQIARFYKQDYIFLRMIQAFAGIALFIGCLGLYGLMSFMAAQRTKEIGVRKVLGASAKSILWLFGKEFLFLLLLAFLIAAPITYWLLKNWLQDYAYRIDLSIWFFIVSGLLASVVALATISAKTIKAATTNPVKSLRTE